MRRLIIAGNWKMNKSVTESMELARKLKMKLLGEADLIIIVCPPFVSLQPLAELLKGGNIHLGAQNMYWEEQGAFTGEISPKMLLSIGVEYVILGHSERRKYFGETDETVNKKIKKALELGLKPIVCIGETLEQREEGKTLEVLERQLTEGLKEVEIDDPFNIVIAYEPIWAIGTGRNATPEQAQEAHHFIRELLGKIYGAEKAEGLTLQYGGSVKPDNARDLLIQEDVDGALVGGASLDTFNFSSIIESGKEVFQKKPCYHY